MTNIRTEMRKIIVGTWSPHQPGSECPRGKLSVQEALDQLESLLSKERDRQLTEIIEHIEGWWGGENKHTGQPLIVRSRVLDYLRTLKSTQGSTGSLEEGK